MLFRRCMEGRGYLYNRPTTSPEKCWNGVGCAAGYTCSPMQGRDYGYCVGPALAKQVARQFGPREGEGRLQLGAPLVVVAWSAGYGAGARHTESCASTRTSKLPGQGSRVRSAGGVKSRNQALCPHHVPGSTKEQVRDCAPHGVAQQISRGSQYAQLLHA